MTDSGNDEVAGDIREKIADEREQIAGERDRVADGRDDRAVVTQERIVRAVTETVGSILQDLAAVAADLAGNAKQRRRHADAAPSGTVPITGSEGSWAVERREFIADDRQERADVRELLADQRESLADQRELLLTRLARYLSVEQVGADQMLDELESDPDRRARLDAGAARKDAASVRLIAAQERSIEWDSDSLAAEFVQMSKSLLHASTPQAAMADVVTTAVRVIHGCDVASFTAVVNGRPTTTAASSPLAERLDEAQYQISEGPCLTAIEDLEIVVVDELTSDRRWPTFAASAVGLAGSMLSAPVPDERQPRAAFGSLNNYALVPHAFEDDTRYAVTLLAAHLSVLLNFAATTSETARQAGQLSEAISSRDVIGQAKGILMERHKITAAEAFDILRMASSRMNRKLRDIADDLATSGEIPVWQRSRNN
jgi:hypothetical protein